MMGKLNVSIVLYHTPIQEVTKMVYCLRMHSDVGQIFLIDNSEHQTAAFQALDATYCFMNKNLGYGSGHNIAMRTSIKEKIPYHLVLNSDMSFNSEILSELLAHMDSHPLVGQMMPKVFYPNGEIQYLCKLLPSPMDLFGRRFLPKRWTEQRNHRFELRHSGYTSIINAPYLSGCFMLLRTEALEKVLQYKTDFFYCFYLCFVQLLLLYFYAVCLNYHWIILVIDQNKSSHFLLLHQIQVYYIYNSLHYELFSAVMNHQLSKNPYTFQSNYSYNVLLQDNRMLLVMNNVI